MFAPFAGNDGPWSDADQTDEATREVLSGFTGHQHDPELGLINMRGRLYDPLSGHFTTPDPFVQQATSAGINRYAYVANNPLRFVDPSGFFGWDPGAFISGLFSGGGSGGGSKASQEQCIDTGNCQDAGSGGSTGTGMLTLNPIVDLTQYGIAGSGITYGGGSGGSSAPTGSAAPNPVGSNFTGPGYGPGGYGAGGLGRTAGDEVAPGELPQGRSIRDNSLGQSPGAGTPPPIDPTSCDRLSPACQEAQRGFTNYGRPPQLIPGMPLISYGFNGGGELMFLDPFGGGLTGGTGYFIDFSRLSFGTYRQIELRPFTLGGAAGVGLQAGVGLPNSLPGQNAGGFIEGGALGKFGIGVSEGGVSVSAGVGVGAALGGGMSVTKVRGEVSVATTLTAARSIYQTSLSLTVLF